MEEGGEQVKEAAPPDSRSLEEKLQDKNWKTRVAAYEELGKKLKNVLGEDPLFNEIAPLMPSIVSDSNASALDAGLAVAIQFFDLMPDAAVVPFLHQHGEKITSNIVNKALSGRTTVQLKGKALILKLMEVDDPTISTTVLLSKLGDKKPKIPPLCLEIIKEGVTLFGAKTFPIRDIIAKLGDVLNKGYSESRASGMSLMLEISKWIGVAPFAPVLETIKPVQKSEFESQCAARGDEPKPKPTLFLRKERAAVSDDQSKESPIKSSNKESSPNDDDDDAREYVQEVDLIKVLKASDYNKLIAESKWSEQLKGLQIVIDSIGPTPKIKSGADVNDIVGVCKGFLRSGHLSLQQASLKILSLLSDGLRSEFANTLRPVLQMVIFKSKEKRLLKDVQDVLVNAVRYCVPYDVMSDDISEMVKNKKNPVHARLILLESVSQIMTIKPDRISNDSLKSIADMLASSCEDSDPKIREMCVKGFVDLEAIIKGRGRSAIEAHKVISKLELEMPKVFKKIQAHKNDDGKSADAPPVSKPALSKIASTSAAAPKKNPSSLPSTLAKSKSAMVTKSSASSLSNKAPPSKMSNDDDADVDEIAMSPEEAVEKLQQMDIPNWDEIQSNMSSSKWQQKVEALESFERYIKENEAGGRLCVPMTVYLKSHFPKLKATNLALMKAIVQLYTTCAENTGSESFSKSVAMDIVLFWGEKFSDKKSKDSIGSLLTVMCNVVSPGFLIKQMKKSMDKTKAPLGHQHYLEWLKTIVDDFGASTLPVPHIVSFCHAELDNKNSAVRNSAVEVFGAIYRQLGPKFVGIAITESLKPALKSLLEAEFEKVGYDPSIRPSRLAKGSESSNGKEEFSIPRTDLSSALDKSIMSDLRTTDGKNSWQLRKAAMEAIMEACERSGHYLEANAATKEVLKCLKARLSDTQANLKPVGASALGHVLSSLDIESCNKYLKPLAGSLLSSIADNKKSMRDAAVSSLQRIVTLGKADALADSTLLGTVLLSSPEPLQNPVGREDLITFLLGHVRSDVTIKADCSDMASSLVVALQDKVASTRVLAEELMSVMVSKHYLSQHTVEKSFRDLPPAVSRSLQAPLERITLSDPASSSTNDTKKSASCSEVSEAPKKVQKEATHSSSHPRRGKIPQAQSQQQVSKSSSSQEKPTSTPTTTITTTSSSNPYFPLKKTNKAKRLEDYYKTNWPQPPEDPGENERVALRATWEPLLEKPLFDILFPDKISGIANQDSMMNGVSELLSILNGEKTGSVSGLELGGMCHEMVIQHTDLMIKWVALALSMRESSNGLLKLLLLVATIFNHIKNTPSMQLHEGEIVCILPALIEKSGHKSERHKLGFKHSINACTPIIPSNRLCQLLLNGLMCKNKKTRVVCIEEIDRIVEISGPAPLGKVGIREISSTLNNKDTDVGVRNAALDFCFTLYVTLGHDRKKLMKLLGDISERAVPMIDHRIKEKMKHRSTEGEETKTSEKSNAVKKDPSSTQEASVTKPSISSDNNKSSNNTESTPAKRSIAFQEDDDDVAFKLDMTPPEAENPASLYSEKPSAIKLEMDTANALPPPPPSDTVESHSNELFAIFTEIISKVDAMLACSGSDNNSSEDSESLKSSVQDAKDHLKVLHTVITGHGMSEPNSRGFDILQQQAPDLVDRLNRSIAFGFENKSSLSIAEEPLGKADVGLISVSLANMFALLDCKDLLRNVSDAKVVEMITTGIRYLVDKRFFPSEGSSLASKMEQDLSRALNAYLLKIGSSRPIKSGVVICSILEVLSLCIEEKELSNALPCECAKPLSRLLLKVLSDEASRGPTKSFHLPNVDSMRLLSVLHSFFNSHPSTVPSNDVPYCCAKTVLAKLIDALGISEIERLSQVLKIPETAFVYRLAKRMSTAADSSDSAGMNQRQAKLNGEIVSMIETITSARDKVAAIDKLRLLLKKYPEENVSQYLQHTSSTFRNFVIDTIHKLDSGHEASSHVESSNSATPSSKSSSNDADGSEALRILEGLKSNSKRVGLTSPRTDARSNSTFSGSSSRSKIQDKIKGTLNSLTATISMDTEQTMSKSSIGSDSDLAARLARLKRLEGANAN